jgi:hypothetical protein
VVLRVYRLRHDKTYQYLYPDKDKDFEALEFKCRPVGEDWKPPTLYNREPFLKKGDFFKADGCFIVNYVANTALRANFEAHSQTLEVDVEGEIFYVINVLQCINCLNKNESDWGYGSGINPFGTPKKYVFHESRLPGLPFCLFKIPQTHEREILLLETWKDGKRDEPEWGFSRVYDEYKLEGLVFDLLWESEA